MTVTNVMDTQVRWQRTSLVPEDIVTNTFHFATRTLSEWINAEFEDVIAALSTFYSAMSGILSVELVRSPAPEVRFYNQGATPPRLPEYQGNLTLTGSWATTAAPSEVAIVSSFQGDPSSGVPQARRRGRIYVGPLAAASGVRPSSTITATIRDATDVLATTFSVHPTLRMVVSSSVTGGFVEVTNGWVDNAWDTQRRRGDKATSRTIWAV